MTKLEEKINTMGFAYDGIKRVMWLDGKVIKFKHYYILGTNGNNSYIYLSEDGNRVLTSSLTDEEREELFRD